MQQIYAYITYYKFFICHSSKACLGPFETSMTDFFFVKKLIIIVWEPKSAAAVVIELQYDSVEALYVNPKMTITLILGFPPVWLRTFSNWCVLWFCCASKRPTLECIECTVQQYFVYCFLDFLNGISGNGYLCICKYVLKKLGIWSHGSIFLFIVILRKSRLWRKFWL